LPDDRGLRRVLTDDTPEAKRDFGGRAIEGYEITLAHELPAELGDLATLVDRERLAADEADLAYLPRHYRRMRGAAADRR
jgi:hypothetical protein